MEKKTSGREKERADVLKPPRPPPQGRMQEKPMKPQKGRVMWRGCNYTPTVCPGLCFSTHRRPVRTGFVHSAVVSRRLETFFSQSYQFPLIVMGPNGAWVNTTPTWGLTTCQETRKWAKGPNSHQVGFLALLRLRRLAVCLTQTHNERTKTRSTV